jgi:hypothetical protein
MALSDNVIRDGDQGFLGFASRLNPTTLPAGMLQESVNMRLDRGVAQTRKGSQRLTDTVGTTGAPLTLDVALGVDKTITAGNLTWSSPTATVVLTAHGFADGAQINIRGADQAEYNGDFLITLDGVDPDNKFSYTVVGSPATPATGTIIANDGPEVEDDYSGGLYAAGVFASQNYDNANEYIALAGADTCYLWRDGLSPVTKTYPTSPNETIESTDTVSVVQAFDRLYILREAAQTISGTSGQIAAHEAIWGTKLTDADGIDVVTTTATVSFAAAHGYPAGATVRIEGSTTAAFNGHEFRIVDAAPGADNTHFTIDVPDGTVTHAAAGIKVRRVKPPIFWDGGSGQFQRADAGVPAEGVTYTKMPSTGFASYINNRLIFARNRDTVAVSDVLDADLYDPFWNSFRVGAGGNDRIVAIHPWVEGQVLIFCRKSIWLATLSQFASTDGTGFAVNTAISSVTQLTNEIGCSARNSIVTAGQFVFFLSDAGIYRLDARLDLKLRGDTMPLSEPIADLFATVNQGRVEKSAFGIWHDNRYLIALPTSSDPLDGNELVVCWNSLNNQWEYRDTYPASAAVNQILVATYQNKRRVFSIPRSGNLYLLEEVTDGTDEAAADAVNDSQPIIGRIKTRRYNFNEMSSKRFLRSVTNVVIPNGATVTTRVNIIDPDREDEQIGTITNDTGAEEDYHLKAPVRFKAHAAELIYETSGGRPEIRSAALEASPKSLPATLTRDQS